MPLHLLGKKSWNVYNHDNIERVRRDEAAARALEEQEEKRMQEVDAERRIQILRGLPVGALPAASVDDVERRESNGGTEARKRRKLAGENDTERDIRFAKEDAESAGAVALRQAGLQHISRKSSDAPLTDKDGHLNLFPAEGSRYQAPKNPEAEAEAAKKKREFEDQYTMRFSNAAGLKQGLEKPWYSSIKEEFAEPVEAVGKDVWGNADKGRTEREKRRMEDADPLLIIKKGVRGLREVESARRKWKEEREREVGKLKERRTRHIRKESRGPAGFTLDAGMKNDGLESGDVVENRMDKNSLRYRSRRRERSRSRSQEQRKEHHFLHRSCGEENIGRKSRQNDDGHRKRPREHGRTRHHSTSLQAAEDEGFSRLRQEREEREEKERKKTSALLALAREGDQPAWVKRSGGRYSNQFASTQQ